MRQSVGYCGGKLLCYRGWTRPTDQRAGARRIKSINPSVMGWISAKVEHADHCLFHPLCTHCWYVYTVWLGLHCFKCSM